MTITLSLRDLEALEPCQPRLIAARRWFSSSTTLTCSQALEAGATVSDILWLAGKLDKRAEIIEFAEGCATRAAGAPEAAEAAGAAEAAKAAGRAVTMAAEAAGWAAWWAAEWAPGAAEWAAKAAERAAEWAAKAAGWAAGWAAEWAAGRAAEIEAQKAHLIKLFG